MFSSTFTFGSPARSPSIDASEASSTRDTSRSVSPFSPISANPPPPRLSVSDLAAQLDRQRIRPEAQICYDSYASYANLDDDADWSIPADVSLRNRSSARPQSPTRRQQRQANSRLLCSATHHKDIAALLMRMLESKDQCSITPPDSLSRAATRETSNEDEGYNSEDDVEETLRPTSRRPSLAALKFRRASDYRKTGASVNKEVRLRTKDKVHRRQRSDEKE
ncbi:hypothetical protein B0A48_03629 [Cryoendolithus antarcticus]|uniref:Uncharacterized protein n=1 Tax=Cryoendolithus antarcticus TaxID=1507870 RepID=A0A1V8TKZ8_9PEZI|nr:hypothetical protein B0A48_03629 [Cryoendolithus antarcticus]